MIVQRPESAAPDILYEDIRSGVLRITSQPLNTLRNLGCSKVGHVIQFCEYELLQEPNFGKGFLKQLKQALTDLGLSLGRDPDYVPADLRRRTYRENIFGVTVDEAQTNVAALAAVVAQCATRFREYEASHTTKGAHDKALRNAAMAQVCEDVLKSVSG